MFRGGVDANDWGGKMGGRGRGGLQEALCDYYSRVEQEVAGSSEGYLRVGRVRSGEYTRTHTPQARARTVVNNTLVQSSSERVRAAATAAAATTK